MQQSVCLVIKPATVDNFASLLHAGWRVSESKMVPTLNYSYKFVWPEPFSSDFGPPVISWWFSFSRVSVLLFYTQRIIMAGVATPLVLVFDSSW